MRLTRAEKEILLSCAMFVDAGEISGSPLEAEEFGGKLASDDDRHPEVQKKVRALESATNKLAASIAKDNTRKAQRVAALSGERASQPEITD